jgi:hypothetical protein
MEKQTDDQIAVSMIAEAKKRFPKLNACSFDKGFHSPANQAELTQHLDQVTLPRKGKLSKVLAPSGNVRFLPNRNVRY